MREYALRESILQFAQEWAVREGISKEQFALRFWEAVRWHEDKYLQIASGISETTGAQLDERSLDDVPTDENPPAIFPA